MTVRTNWTQIMIKDDEPQITREQMFRGCNKLEPKTRKYGLGKDVLFFVVSDR